MTDFARLARQRHSVRAYLDRPVDRATLEDICATARLAPSGANLQPGRLHVLTGKALLSLSDALLAAQASNRPVDAEYSYFPDPMPAHLKDRQRAAGYALYEALGILRRDLDGRRAQFARNYRFFDAPVGIVVTIDRAMGKGCFMDLGMAIMTLLYAAQDKGLGATGIGALANYASVVQDHLELDDSEMVVCGIALGHPDPDHPANTVRTARCDLEEFTLFHGFED